MPEREEEEKEIKNIFEKIMKEHFPNLVNRHASPGRSESPKRLDPRKYTQRHIIIKLLNIKDKARLLNSAREKKTVTYKRVPIRVAVDFSKETLQTRRGWKEVFKVRKRQGPTSKMTLSSKAII